MTRRSCSTRTVYLYLHESRSSTLNQSGNCETMLLTYVPQRQDNRMQGALRYQPTHTCNTNQDFIINKIIIIYNNNSLFMFPNSAECCLNVLTVYTLHSPHFSRRNSSVMLILPVRWGKMSRLFPFTLNQNTTDIEDTVSVPSGKMCTHSPLFNLSRMKSIPFW